MSFHRVFGVTITLGALVGVAACDGSISSDLFSSIDGGPIADDAGSSKNDGEAPPDTTPDASTTRTVDTGTVTGPSADASIPPPSKKDASTAVVDAHAVHPDTGTVTPPPTGVDCVGITCTASETCCVSQAQGGGTAGTCIAAHDMCENGITVACLANTDCGAEICCVKVVNGLSATCKPTCAAQGEGQICTTAGASTCPAGQTCITGGGFQGYGVCFAGMTGPGH